LNVILSDSLIFSTILTNVYVTTSNQNRRYKTLEIQSYLKANLNNHVTNDTNKSEKSVHWQVSGLTFRIRV